MHRRAHALATTLLCSAILHAGTTVPGSGAPDDGDTKGKAADPGLFGLTRVVRLHIEITADEYQAMQPPAPAGGFGGPPPAPRERKPGERESERNLFGVEFPWAPGRSRWRARRFRASACATREMPPTWPRPGG